MKKLLMVTVVISLLSNMQTNAMYPAYNTYGWLLLNSENESSPYVKANAVMLGVEQWYKTYEWMINQYIQSGSFYQYIYINGSWTNTYITPRVLAEQIYCDYNLGLMDTPSEVVDELESKIIYEDTYGWSGQTIDPISTWKWRSYYMEGMYAENDFTTCNQINANCWGTADYLAMDNEWEQKYVSDFPSGAPDWGSKFPHIYLDGGKYYPSGQFNEYCIDDDLNPYQNWKAELKGHRYGTSNYPQPENLLNAFDVIRLAEDPIDPNNALNYELEINNINVGENLHCVAYICTDQLHRAWIYEKHNYGCTMYCPYGLSILGNDQWTSPVAGIGMYNNSYCSFFKKFGWSKRNLANTWDMNWSGITE